MGSFPFSSIRRQATRILRHIVIVLAASLAAGSFAISAQADAVGITVTTGPQTKTQSGILHSNADQTIRIIIADPVRPGIRPAPVAEPVIYVIEDDDTVRPVH